MYMNYFNAVVDAHKESCEGTRVQQGEPKGCSLSGTCTKYTLWLKVLCHKFLYIHGKRIRSLASYVCKWISYLTNRGILLLGQSSD